MANCKQQKLQQSELPHDVITYQILVRLPIKCLTRFKSVSKRWYATISSHDFGNAHFKFSPYYQNPSGSGSNNSSPPTQCVFIQSGQKYFLYSYDDNDDFDVTDDDVFAYGMNDNSDSDNEEQNDNDSEIDDDDEEKYVAYYGPKGLVKLDIDFDPQGNKFSFVGSCNGLVCLASSLGNLIVIWNPVSRQFRKISAPCLMNSSNSKGYTQCWGFGYASSIDDYKVVQIIEIEMPQTLKIVVHVFSFRTNTWRRIDDEQHKNLFSLGTTMSGQHTRDCVHDDCIFIQERGVLVNETLYWIVVAKEEIRDEFKRNIVAFSLVLERFDKFPNLDLSSSNSYNYNFLVIMGGCLTKCEVELYDHPAYITILKSPGKTKSIHLPAVICLDLVGFTRTGKFFLLAHQTCYKGLGVVEWSPSYMHFTPLVEFESVEQKVAIANHVPSLISPSPFSGLEEV